MSIWYIHQSISFYFYAFACTYYKYFQRKITDLERLKENQRAKYLAEIQGLDQQLTAMQDDMSQKVQEYQDLMDIKVALDMEISAYRKLLESEERRLSITPNTSVVGSPRGKKRKLFHRDEAEYEFSNIITASATGDIEISEVCPDGQYVKLFNKGSKVINVIFWQQFVYALEWFIKNCCYSNYQQSFYIFKHKNILNRFWIPELSTFRILIYSKYLKK